MKVVQLTDIKLHQNPNYYLSEDALIFSHKKNNNKKILVKNFLNDFDSIEFFIRRVNKHYNIILPVLAEFLNDIHNEKESIIYWERLTGFWLHSIISNYLEKKDRLDIAFNLSDDIVAESISYSSFNTPLNTREFFKLMRSSSYFHLQQYSVILSDHYSHKFMQHNKEWSTNKIPSIFADGSKSVKITFKQKFKKKILSLIDKGYKSKIAFYVSHFSNHELFSFFWRSNFNYAPIFEASKICISRNENKRMRHRILKYSTNNSLSNHILHNSVMNFFPIELMEGYSRILREANKIIKSNVPIAIITGIGFIWNSQFAIWAAKCANLGAKLYGIQHGGTYGEVKALPGEMLERKLTDFYITWGWKENFKTITLPASRLMGKLKAKHIKKKKNRILWVTTADSRYNYFVGHIVFGNRFLNYFKHQHELYELFGENIQSKIYIRLYAFDFGWKMKERWLDKFKNIKFADNKENFISQSLESRLVILDHFGGTTFLELISMNIPTIIIASPELFVFREDARMAYKALEEFGIVYISKKVATKKIRDIIKNPEKWWNETSRQDVLKKFKEQYAYTNGDALSIWMKFLNKTVKK